MQLIILFTIQLTYATAQLTHTQDNWLDLMNFTDSPKDDQDLWAGVCQTGTKQSPIELFEVDAAHCSATLSYDNIQMEHPDVAILYNGYVVMLYNFAPILQLRGGVDFKGLSYIVEQIHFHCGAEHIMERINYDMEVQIVHRNASSANLSEAMSQEKGLVIMSIMFKVSKEPNKVIANIIDALRSGSNTSQSNGQVYKMEQSFIMKDLISNFGNFYQYHGSLTVPRCQENVIWIVLAEVKTITLDQLEPLCNFGGMQMRQSLFNIRKLQATNNRIVFYTGGVPVARPYRWMSFIFLLLNMLI